MRAAVPVSPATCPVHVGGATSGPAAVDGATGIWRRTALGPVRSSSRQLRACSFTKLLSTRLDEDRSNNSQPTARELRAMTYASIIGGARGIQYFILGALLPDYNEVGAAGACFLRSASRCSHAEERVVPSYGRACTFNRTTRCGRRRASWRWRCTMSARPCCPATRR